ncbi:MAG: ABC transporter ATP-binding protein [Bacillota bacterium]
MRACGWYYDLTEDDRCQLVELVELTKRFGDVVAVDGISLSVRPGEFLTLLGPSGCGKTTTLRMIAGFENPTSGEIYIDGVEMGDKPPYLRPVNTVFQQYALFPHLTVYDNIAFGLRVKKVKEAEVRARVERVVRMLGLEGLEGRRPRQLSGGQQQRVALARALVVEPKVLLLDEPLGALDLKLRQQIQLEIKALQNALGITFIYVTHDQDEALTMSDRIVVMRGGRIEQVGTPRQIYTMPETRFVASFIGEANIFDGIAVEEGGTGGAIEWKGRVLRGRQAVRPIPEGSAAALIVRPEDVCLSRVDGEPEPAGDELIGRVVEEIYGGDHVRIMVQLTDGMRIRARVGSEQAGLYPVGSTVKVAWPEGAPILVAGD